MFYSVKAGLGTPPQEVQLLIDTGCSDTWVYDLPSCFSSVCVGGAFNETESSTFSKTGEQFSNAFLDATAIRGDYFLNHLAIGQATVNQVKMATVRVPTRLPVGGLLGLGFDINEAVVLQSGNAETQPYPNVMDSLKSQGVIGTRSFSLYCNAQDADPGATCFGGYDTAKFKGDLSVLHVAPDQSRKYPDLAIRLSSIGITGSDGPVNLTTEGFQSRVVLDSGSSVAVLPPDAFDQAAKYLRARYDNGYGGWLVPCDLSGETSIVDFQFGSLDGPLISVCFDELSTPIIDPNTGDAAFNDFGKPLCQFGFDRLSDLEVRDGSPLLFGNTFLRSVYVVFDLDNRQIGIAQAIPNATGSNILPITSSLDQL